MSDTPKKSRLLGVGLVVVFLLLLIEWRPWHSLSRGNQLAEQQLPLAPIAEKNPENIELQPIRAQLSPVRYTTVAAELGARVEEIPFREGENFKEGQKIVVFDCATQQAQLGKAKAVMAIAERNYLTNKKLLALGAIGRVEYENSANEYQKTKSEADELAAVVSKCVIHAPFDGRVVEQKVRAQQFVQAGQPVLEILDHSALELEFIAPSKWSGWLLPNYVFRIKIEETGKSYPAKITRVGAKIDSISQTIKVAAVIDGDFADLAPGMSGTLEIQQPAQ